MGPPSPVALPRLKELMAEVQVTVTKQIILNNGTSQQPRFKLLGIVNEGLAVRPLHRITERLATNCKFFLMRYPTGSATLNKALCFHAHYAALPEVYRGNAGEAKSK